MADRTNLVIAKFWNNPTINTFVSNELISLMLSRRDYLFALVEEARDLSKLATKEEVYAELLAASERVEARIKQASTVALSR
jgi:hypothetical protein